MEGPIGKDYSYIVLLGARQQQLNRALSQQNQHLGELYKELLRAQEMGVEALQDQQDLLQTIVYPDSPDP